MQRFFRDASRYFILFMTISFLGWVVETAFFLFCYGSFYDRGFMTLPFCTIYGFSFLLLYFLIGTPGVGPTLFLPKQCQRKTVSPVLYFLLCTLLPTGLELITGSFFHEIFGIRLWDYSAYRFHLSGYICLEYALLWGLLIPPCMKYLFAPLKKRIFLLSSPCVRPLSAMLILLTATDWIVNFSKQWNETFFL